MSKIIVEENSWDVPQAVRDQAVQLVEALTALCEAYQIPMVSYLQFASQNDTRGVYYRAGFVPAHRLIGVPIMYLTNAIQELDKKAITPDEYSEEQDS